MTGPQQGEPYAPWPGPAVSVGDMRAAPGTEAWKAVTVVDPTGIPSPNIIDTGAPFDLEVRLRCSTMIPAGYPIPPGLSANFHALNLLTGTPAGIFGAAGPTLIPQASWPDGDSGPRGIGDVVTWYRFNAAGLNLPDGTYRIIVHGHDVASGLMFFHDGTVIHVGP